MSASKPRGPLPDESLDGYVAFRSDLRGLPNVGEIADAVGLGNAAFHRFSRLEGGTADLETELGLAPGTLAGRDHPARDGTARDFFGAAVDRLHLVTKRRTFCPAALARSPHHRAVWDLAPFPFSDETWDHAVSHCLDPICGKRQGLFRTLGVANCDVCGETLAREGEGEVPSADRAALRLAVGLVHPDAGRRREAAARLPAGIRDAPAGDLLDLLVALAGVVDPGVRSPVNRRALRPEAEPDRVCAAMAAAWRTLESWPASFRTLADGLAGHRAAGRIDGNGGATCEFLMLPDRPGTPAGLASLILAERDRMSPEAARAIPANVAARLPGLNARVLPHARLSGRIPARLVWVGTGVDAMVDRDAAEGESRAFSDSAPIHRVAAELGCGVHGVEQMCALGLLGDRKVPLLPLSGKAPRVPLAGVRAFVDRLNAAADEESFEAWTDLGRALLGIGGRSKPIGPITSAMLDGILPFRLVAGRGGPFSRIEIPVDAVRDIERLSFDRRDHPGFPFVAMVPKTDAAIELNLSPADGVDALRRFETNRRRATVPVVWLTETIADRVSVAEIGARLSLSPRSAWHLARRVGGPSDPPRLYERRALEAVIAGQPSAKRAIACQEL